MEHTQNKRNGMTRHMRILSVFLVPVVALILGVASPNCWAGFLCPVELDEAKIFFEINATDGDGGLQFFLDGEPWKRLTIFTPNWRRHVTVTAGGNLRKQGITELFSESGEPSFDEQPLEELLGLFPPGDYHFLGLTVNGKWLKGEAELTHDLPCPPKITSPEEPEDDAPPPSTAFPIIWDQVVSKLDSISIVEEDGEEVVEYDCKGEIVIVGYEVVYEIVIEEVDDERVFEFVVNVPQGVTQVTVPSEFASLADDENLLEAKIEVIAQEESGNKTITERVLFEAE